MRTATLSGWGQAHDALAAIAPDALHIDYARHHSAQAALLEIKAQAKDCDVIIGWSLGGQMAVRGVASGLIRPKALILIATPFQFVVTADKPIGMKRDLYDKFRNNYERDKDRTLAKAWELICKDDAKAGTVRDHLSQQNKNDVMNKDWLQWLDNLDGFSCEMLDFSGFPPTLLLHGDGDAVVFPNQSEQFKKSIPHAKLLTLPGCGHAPHWHDPAFVTHAIREVAYV